MSIELVMLFNHLILCHPFSCCFNPSQHQGLFQWIGSLHQVVKVLSFSINPFKEYSVLISFRIDWFDLLAVQGTLKSLLKPLNSKASILRCSAFFTVQLSHPYLTTGKTTALTIKPVSPVSLALQVDSLPLSHWGSQDPRIVSINVLCSRT